ncbi:MAG: DUF3987 domain-containing protein [bacterium]
MNSIPQTQQILQTIIDKSGARKNGSGWLGRCPSHNDRTPSLSIGTGDDGRILLKCFAGCSIENITTSLGISMRDLFPDSGTKPSVPEEIPPSNGKQKNPKRETRPVTVEDLARDKALPVDFLRKEGLENDNGGVVIPYFLENGEPARRHRLRTASKAGDGSIWTAGDGDVVAYGLQDLDQIRESGNYTIVEGETDRLTAKCHGFSAVGIPGASMTKTLMADHLVGIKTLYVVNEGDEGGESFIKGIVSRLRELNWAGNAYEIDMPTVAGVKDLNDLHKRNPERFKEDFQSILDSAVNHEPVYRYVEGEGPRPLQRELEPSDPYPLDALGPILGPAARVIQESVQAPDAICGNSILAAAALAVQPFSDVEIDGRKFPLSEFFLTVGLSGERKSAVDSLVLRAHREYQESRMEQYRKDMDLWKRDSEIYEKAKQEALSAKHKNTTEKRTAVDALGDPPALPRLPMSLYQEPTYEGMIKLFQLGSPSAGLFTDEGGRFLGGHAMNSDNQIKTAAGLCELWDGKPITRVRSGEGASLISGRRFSAHIMGQPSIANMLLSNPALGEQGLISRFLAVFPETTCGSRLYRQSNPYNTPELRAYYDRVRAVLEAEMPIVEGTEAELNPRRINLAPEAKKLWIQFHDKVEKQLSPDGVLSSVRGMANKAPEHAARLAGILALFHQPTCTTITLEEMEWGITLTSHYLNETLRLYQTGCIDQKLETARRVLNWLKKRDTEIITLVEAYQRGPNQIRSAGEARRMMSVLQEHGWLTQLPNGAEFEGKHRAEAWRVVK